MWRQIKTQLIKIIVNIKLSIKLHSYSRKFDLFLHISFHKTGSKRGNLVSVYSGISGCKSSIEMDAIYTSCIRRERVVVWSVLDFDAYFVFNHLIINNTVLNRSNMRAQYAANKLNCDNIHKLHKTFVNVYKSIQ